MGKNVRNTHTNDNKNQRTQEKTALQVIDERNVLEKDFKVYGTVDEPLFIARDVAEWIDYDLSSVSKMLASVDDDEKLVGKIFLSGQHREVWLLTESGLYEVLMQSQKPIAKAFKKEVKAILKELRTTGGFISDTEKFIEDCFGDCDEEVKAFMKATINQRKADKQKIIVLEAQNTVLAQEAVQWGDRATINALVRAYGGHLGGDYSTAWRDFKKELLYKHGINLNARLTAYLNESGKKTKPKTLDMLHEHELPQALSTAIALCRNAKVDIDDIIASKIEQ